MADNAKWYVIHTYSGYENTVAASILKAAENRRMQDLILEVNIPMETVTEHTDGGEKTVNYLTKAFPDAEVSLINGGQPVYYYLISAE